MTKEYICECGKILYSPQSFNGHKSSCKIHLAATGKLEARQQVWQNAGTKVSKSLKNFAKVKSEEAQAAWLIVEHKCECCNKIMTEKFGSGRFCSRACANKRVHSDTTKQKLSIKSKLASPKLQAERRAINEAIYLQNPKLCIVCDEIIPYDLRERNTCSDTCYRQLRADIRVTTMETQGIHSGFNTTFLKSSFRYGFYKGIKCDSGWELAFLLYHLAQGNNIIRNTDYFIYQFEGVPRRYYPDFIVDSIYYEIKGYKDDKFFEKVAQFPTDKTLKIIDSDSIKFYLEFAEKTYGEDFYTLYDLDRPNWMQIV